MAKFGAGKIWHTFLNTTAKFGTILLCQISPFQISPIPKFPPSGNASGGGGGMPLRPHAPVCTGGGRGGARTVDAMTRPTDAPLSQGVDGGDASLGRGAPGWRWGGGGTHVIVNLM